MSSRKTMKQIRDDAKRESGQSVFVVVGYRSEKDVGCEWFRDCVRVVAVASSRELAKERGDAWVEKEDRTEPADPAVYAAEHDYEIEEWVIDQDRLCENEP